MKNRKGLTIFGLWLILLVVIVVILMAFDFEHSVQPAKNLSYNLSYLSEISQKQSFNVYIAVTGQSGSYQPTELCYETENYRGIHYVPLSNDDKLKYCNGITNIDGIDYSHLIYIDAHKYFVLYFNPNGNGNKVYIVTSMKNGKDTSMVPLDHSIYIYFYDSTQPSIKIGPQGVYVYNNNK